MEPETKKERERRLTGAYNAMRLALAEIGSCREYLNEGWDGTTIMDDVNNVEIAAALLCDKLDTARKS